MAPQPVEELGVLMQKLPEGHAGVLRWERAQVATRRSVEAERAGEVAARPMMEGDRRLNQPLIEAARRIARLQPELFERIVRGEKLAMVEELDAVEQATVNEGARCRGGRALSGLTDGPPSSFDTLRTKALSEVEGPSRGRALRRGPPSPRDRATIPGALPGLLAHGH